jgi:hypothetical protein
LRADCFETSSWFVHRVEYLGSVRLTSLLADLPPALWFSYVYVHGSPAGNHHGHVTQRVKLDNPHFHMEKLAHITNYIFEQGYIAPKFRSMVHWERHCGGRVAEHVLLNELLGHGEGLSEEMPLKLIIGQSLSAEFTISMSLTRGRRSTHLGLILRLGKRKGSLKFKIL